MNWVYYLTTHNHSKRHIASDKEDKGPQASVQLTEVKHRGDKLPFVYKNCVYTKSSCNANVCHQHLKTGMQKLNVSPDFGTTSFLFLLPFQRAIKFYDQHFIDPNEQYHTEVGQLTTLSFSWPDSYCGNLGGHYWCRLAWQCLSVLQDMMLSSAKIKNNINKQVKKNPKSQNCGLMIPGDFKGADAL